VDDRLEAAQPVDGDVPQVDCETRRFGGRDAENAVGEVADVALMTGDQQLKRPVSGPPATRDQSADP
jgi:hypothetical protein